MKQSATYPGSQTLIVDKLPVYRCRCGYITWAVTRDKRIRCPKCGMEMEAET